MWDTGSRSHTGILLGSTMDADLISCGIFSCSSSLALLSERPSAWCSILGEGKQGARNVFPVSGMKKSGDRCICILRCTYSQSMAGMSGPVGFVAIMLLPTFVLFQPLERNEWVLFLLFVFKLFIILCFITQRRKSRVEMDCYSFPPTYLEHWCEIHIITLYVSCR